MSLVDIDTDKVNNSIEQFDVKIVTYHDNIQAYFELVKNIPDYTKEWQSDAAEKFVRQLVNKKSQYEDFENTLIDFSEKLKACTKRIENAKKSNTYERGSI